MCFHMRLTLENGVSGLEKMEDQVKMRKTYKIMDKHGRQAQSVHKMPEHPSYGTPSGA